MYYRDGGEQSFRHIGDDDPDEEDDGIQPVVPEYEGDDEEGDTEEDCHPGDEVDEMADLSCDRGLPDFKPRRQVRDSTHYRPISSVDDHSSCISYNDHTHNKQMKKRHSQTLHDLHSASQVPPTLPFLPLNSSINYTNYNLKQSTHLRLPPCSFSSSTSRDWRFLYRCISQKFNHAANLISTWYTMSFKINRVLCNFNSEKLPSTAFVEKKARFFVSRGLSCVNSAVLLCGSDSPVRDELSTWSRNETTVNPWWHVEKRIESNFLS